MSKVLIVSFSGVQDADRLGTFINRDGTAEPELIDYVFRDLAAVHGVTVEWLKRFYTDGDYFAWDWSRHPLTMGLFFFPMIVQIPLNVCFRYICDFWSGCVRRLRSISPNTPPCCSRKALLRWGGDRHVPYVCQLTIDTPPKFLI